MNPLAILGRLGDSVAVPAAPSQVPHGAWQRNWRELIRKAIEEKKSEKKRRKLLTVGRIFAVGGRAIVRFTGTVESEAQVAALGRKASVLAEGFTKDSRAMMAVVRAAQPTRERIPDVQDTVRVHRRAAATYEAEMEFAVIEAENERDLAELEEIGACR
jgi:hypothetical protein